MMGEAYYSRTPDYTFYSGVHVCWSDHSDSSFVYRFMSLDYGLGTMTTTTFKLRQNGIRGKLLAWISNYLSSRKQSVKINSATYSLLSVNASVPLHPPRSQGSVLGPFLFLIYVNDIAENLLSLVRLFADDKSLFFPPQILKI